MGISGVDQAASLDVLVLQHEVISFVESVMREIEFSESTLGLEEIEAVAGTGKTFLDRDHTLEHFRKELWVPTLLDRQYYQGWLEGWRLEHRGALPPAEATNLTHTTSPNPLRQTWQTRWIRSSAKRSENLPLLDLVGRAGRCAIKPFLVFRGLNDFCRLWLGGGPAKV